MSAPTKVGLDDFLVARGRDALRVLLDRAEPFGDRPAAPDPSPADAQQDYGPAQPPLEVLPKKVRPWVKTTAGSIGCPVDFIFTLVLVVAATLIGRKRGVSPKPGWIEYAIIWLLIVASSGGKKTPAFNATLEPLWVITRRLLAAYRDEVAKWNARTSDEKDAPRPTLRQVMTTNFTLEALHALCGSNQPGDGVCVAVDEAAGLVRGLDQYKGKGNDRQELLSLGSGQPVIKHRAGAEPLVIDRDKSAVSACGGIQPDVLGEVFDGRAADGMAARFHAIFPSPLPPAPWSAATVPVGSAEWQRVCDKLFGLKPRTEPLTLDPAAEEVWAAFYNAHNQEQPPVHLQPYWAKCEGYCLRLALVLTMLRWACGEADGERVDATAMTGAVKLVAYFKDHARRVYAAANQRGDRGRVGETLAWIRQRGGKVTAREIRQFRKGGVKTGEEAVELLDDLAELGHGSVVKKVRKDGLAATFTLKGGA